MPVWDTSIVSRLRPGDDLLGFADAAALTGSPIRVVSPTIHEVAYGYSLRIAEAKFRAIRSWFEGAVGGGVFEVLQVSNRASLVSGAIRASRPFPPTAPRKRAKGSKPDRRVAWVHDIQIAVVAWFHGEPIYTRDTEHFASLSRLLGHAFPDESRLQVRQAPDLAS